MGMIHRYIERRRVLRLLAELERSLCKSERVGSRREATRLGVRRASL